MQPDGSAPSHAEVTPAEQMPVAVWWHGVICFGGLSFALLVEVLFFVSRNHLPPFSFALCYGLLAQFISIHFANWCFIRKFHRAMLSSELTWFAVWCSIARYIIDTLIPLAFAISIHLGSEWSARDVAGKIAAAFVAFAIVFVIVYGTVPWISNRIIALSPNKRWKGP